MSRTLRGILALVTVAVVTVTAPATARPTAAGDAVESSVVILTSSGTGSGAIIGDGQVLTAAHVLDGASDIRIQTDSGGVKATIRTSDDERDLALLSAPGLEGPALDLRDDPAQLGEETYAVGAPSGRYLQISRGIVSAVVNQAGVERIQTDAPVNPGNSGGPLVDENGDVLGVVVTKSRTEEGIAFATSTAEVRQFLGDNAAPAVAHPSSAAAPSSSASTEPVDPEPATSPIWVVLTVLVTLAGAGAVLQRRRGRRGKVTPTLDLTFEDLSGTGNLGREDQELSARNRETPKIQELNIRTPGPTIRTTETMTRKEEEQWIN